MILFADSETSGMLNFKQSYEHPTQPWPVQIAAILADDDGRVVQSINLLVKSDSRTIHPKAQEVHGLDIETLDKYGFVETEVIALFYTLCLKANALVCHNVSFDQKIFAASLFRCWGAQNANTFMKMPTQCTMKEATDFCKLPGRFGKPKWPKLSELHQILFEESFEGAHDALADIKATMRCYYELVNKGIMQLPT
jgi:DNA polymerase-3 subunit epsilon